MTYYTGLDVSLHSVSVCIVDDEGAIKHEANVEQDPDNRTFARDWDSCGHSAVFHSPTPRSD